MLLEPLPSTSSVVSMLENDLKFTYVDSDHPGEEDTLYQ